MEYPGEQNQDYRVLQSSLSRKRWRRVLDAGCGRGLYTRRLPAFAAHVSGLDCSLDKLRTQPRTGASLVAGCVERLPYRDDAFDLALCIELVTHVPVPGHAVALAELFRVLQPGGTLAISVHNATRYRGHLLKRRLTSGAAPGGNAPIFPMSTVQLTHLLERTGFRLVGQVRYLNFFNRFSFSLARRHPLAASCLAAFERAMSTIPGLRSLSITLFVEAIKPRLGEPSKHVN